MRNIANSFATILAIAVGLGASVVFAWLRST